VALLLTGALLLVPALSARAEYAPVPAKICPIDWRKGTWFVKKLIRCAAWHYAVPGRATKALSIANRESRFQPGAYNPYSGALGIYQHLSVYWPGRAYAFGFKDWSAFNARANIIVTMRMVRRIGGWGPWGG
jgi:hypothetical protein